LELVDVYDIGLFPEHASGGKQTSVESMMKVTIFASQLLNFFLVFFVNSF
jgi:hypothetical protein